MQQHIASIDWSYAGQAARMCNLHEMAPCARLQSPPWGELNYPARVPADVRRAMGIAVEVVMASVSTKGLRWD